MVRMRTILSTTLVGLALSTTAGCGALDEIDKANAKMPSSKKAKAAAPSAATDQADAGNPLLERSKQWWDEAKSLSPTESSSAIVQCRLASGTQFMDRDDCRARGGVAS